MTAATTIEIAADSRGVKTGLVDANRALDETTKKADRATKSVGNLGTKSKAAGKNMSAAFAATGGGLSVTHGLAGISSGFRSADGSMVAFAASQALLDMGRMAEDMRGVAGATGTATTMFGRLGAVMKAHPIMTIAALLAVAASAMAAFGGKTSESADEMNRLADAMEKVRLGREASQLLGISEQSPAQQEQSNIRSMAEAYVAAQKTGGMTYGQMAGSLGQQYNVGRLLSMQRGAGVAIPKPTTTTLPQAVGGGEVVIPYQERKVSKEAAQAILRAIYGSIQAEIAGYKPKPTTTGVPAGVPAAPSGGALGAGGFAWGAGPYNSHHAGAFNPAAAGGGGGGSGAGLSPQQLAGMPGTPNWNMAAFDQQAFGSMGQGVLIDEERRAELMAAQQQSMAEANQHMQELIMAGEQFGQTIGDAFMQVATGTMTARDAMAQLVQQFAQMASSSIFRQIGGAVAGSFGPTQAQSGQNQVPGGSLNSGG